MSPGAETLRDLTGRWWVAHTKSRFEKAFAWDLMNRGIGHFLPLIERTSISGARKRRRLVPLFPSYVFFCGGQADRYAALRTNRLCQVLKVADQQRLIEELLAIEKALAGKAELDPCPFAAVGKRCRVKAGPFQGLEGLVVTRNKVARLVLQVSILGQGAAIELDTDLLEEVN
ncbi:MAG: transcription termination/antitermination protein NusG [Planctomycetota bacterium]